MEHSGELGGGSDDCLHVSSVGALSVWALREVICCKSCSMLWS